MSRIPETELARLKAEVSVQRLVEGCGVVLRQQGRDLVGVCPFHDDSTPSLVVTPGKNLWHCLGACARGGGPIDWVVTAQGVSFRHAVELLRESSPSLGSLAQSKPAMAGVVGRSKTSKMSTLVPPDAGDQELLNRVVGYYAETLAAHEDARAFLARRKIDHPEAVEQFQVGFADRTLGYRLPGAHVQAGKQVRTRLRDLGIIKSTGHEHFRGYVTIPVADAVGNVGEVYGRKLAREDTRTGSPKHLYLPGPHRGVFNIGAFEATDELIVCESLIDALTLWCAGFRHVTAAYGVDGWTPGHQAAVVEHGIGRVLVAFDGDEAGDRGATALAGELGAAGVEVFRVELPRGADVNEVAVEATNPTEVLGRFLRKASWMGGAQRRASRPVPAPVVAPGLASPAHAVEPVEPTPTVIPVAAAVVEEPAADADPQPAGQQLTDPAQVVGVS